jgi:hypothetical protein
MLDRIEFFFLGITHRRRHDVLWLLEWFGYSSRLHRPDSFQQSVNAMAWKRRHSDTISASASLCVEAGGG